MKKEYFIRFKTNLNECLTITVKSVSRGNAPRQLKRKYDVIEIINVI